jgi:hypothetical protein
VFALVRAGYGVALAPRMCGTDVGATTASAVNYLVPIAAVVVGAIFLNERITANVVAGGMTVLVGMAYAENRLTLPLRPRRLTGSSRPL